MGMYNLLVFLIPFKRESEFWSTFWIGYSFTMLAMVLTAGVGLYAFGRKGLQSKFYGVPLMNVVIIYFTIQLVFGFLEMIFELPFQFGFLVNSILLGACLIGLITLNATKKEIERIDEEVNEKGFYKSSLLTMQINIECLVDRAQDESLKKALTDLSETIKYSDPLNSPQLAELENKIGLMADSLAKAVEKADYNASQKMCHELQLLITERNRKSKILK